MTFLLDTNTWVAHLRGKHPQVTSKILTHQSSDLALCTIVLAELYYGAFHSGAANVSANLLLIDQFRAMFPLIGFDEFAAKEYGAVRESLGRIGKPIGPNDTLIASIARVNGFTLVTNNTSEFSRVPGLVCEDWQTP